MSVEARSSCNNGIISLVYNAVYSAYVNINYGIILSNVEDKHVVSLWLQVSIWSYTNK